MSKKYTNDIDFLRKMVIIRYGHQKRGKLHESRCEKRIS